MTRPTRLWPQDERVILDSENVRSSCLAADAATGTTWWQGNREADATSITRVCSDPLMLTVQDLFDPPLVEIDLWGIFDNQNGGAAITLRFGANVNKLALDAEEHAVQTTVGPATGNLRYAHTYDYTPAAATKLGMWRFLARMSWGLQKTLDHDSSVMSWKQMWASQLWVRSDNGVNTFVGAGNAFDTSMGFTNFDATAGMRITPFFGKSASHQLRMLLTGGIVRTIPENNRPSLVASGIHGGL